MGHIRVGRLPKRHGWDSVIAALEAETKSDKQIMDDAAKGAAKSLGVTRYQGSLNLCYWLFLSLVRAARSDDFIQSLDQIGLHIRPGASAATFVAATAALARSRCALTSACRPSTSSTSCGVARPTIASSTYRSPGLSS